MKARRDEGDGIGPSGPVGTFKPRMSQGELLRIGLSDQELEEAWIERFGALEVDSLMDVAFASSEEGWIRRREMFDELRR